MLDSHLQKKWTLRKSGSQPIEKADPMPQFTVLVQKHLYDKLEVTEFKYDNNFSLKLQPKNT